MTEFRDGLTDLAAELMRADPKLTPSLAYRLAMDADAAAASEWHHAADPAPVQTVVVSGTAAAVLNAGLGLPQRHYHQLTQAERDHYAPALRRVAFGEREQPGRCYLHKLAADGADGGFFEVLS